MSPYASEVLPGLWVAGMPAAEWPLSDTPVRLVVSLSEHNPPQAARRYEWATKGGAAGDGEIAFLHWPIHDGDLPDLALLEMVVATVVGTVRRGYTVLVHCHEGRNRSGLVAALAVRQLTGCSGLEALDRVRQSRTGMLSNRTFAQHLAALPPTREAGPPRAR